MSRSVQDLMRNKACINMDDIYIYICVVLVLQLKLQLKKKKTKTEKKTTESLD